MSSRSKKVQPEVPRELNARDTKQWCKGRVGKLHDIEWVVNQHHRGPFPRSEHAICRICGKQVDYRLKKYTVGQVVKAIRKDQVLSQDDLAKKMGVSQPRVAAIESTTEPITVETMRKLAMALGIPFRVTFGDTLIDCSEDRGYFY